MTAETEESQVEVVSTFEHSFCGDDLPRLLSRAGVHRSRASRIALDVASRARAVAALPSDYFDVLVTPFLEEVSKHRPVSAPAWLRAAVVVVVRNSALEDSHALGGPLGSRDIAMITEAATAPLQELLESPPQRVDLNPLLGLEQRYPRAWACMSAVSDLLASNGGQATYEVPQAAVPPLPRNDELIQARESEHIKGVNDSRAMITSGVDPRFDQALVGMMRQVRAGMAEALPISALSRLSRNSEKQFRVLEFLLAHKTTVLTTNYLLAPGKVAVRARPLVKPDSYNPSSGWHVEQGLVPDHRNLARALRKQF